MELAVLYNIIDATYRTNSSFLTQKIEEFKQSILKLKHRKTKPHIHPLFDYSICSDYTADISQNEINDVVLFTDRLWNEDKNRLEIGKDLLLNIGKKLQVRCKDLSAQDKLITYVNKDYLEKPTFKALINIFNDYDPVLQHKRKSLFCEKEEHINKFLEEISKTNLLILVHKYLLKCRLTRAVDYDDFISELKHYWFRYQNDINESCLFQHVFLGQIRESKHMVTGYHNWIKYYFDQESNEITFNGHLYSIKDPLLGKDVDVNPYYLTLRFLWKGLIKRVDGFFVGTSPEYDFAISTLALYFGRKYLPIHVNGFNMQMATFFNKNTNHESLAATTYVLN